MTLMLWLALSTIVGLLGRDRALGFVGNFVFALLFSPILMLLILLITMPTKTNGSSR
jgi:hypothetical protein